MSESGLVMMREVNDAPGPVVLFWTILAPTISALALVVVAAPLSLDALLPLAPMTTSTGFTGSMPRYSAIRMSAKAAAGAKVTVTVLPAAGAAAMLAA